MTETMMMATKKGAKRTDIHRPGAIVPSSYRPVLAYHGATSDNGWPVPSFGVNCELDRRWEEKVDGKTVLHNGTHDEDGRCCVLGLLHVAKVKFAATGNTCKCSVCGAHFVYGEVWEHESSGEHIHLGHECAAKYELVACVPGWSAKLEAVKRHRVAAIESMMADRRLDAFCQKRPYMANVFEIDHPIIRDMRMKVRHWGDLSEKQIDFACSLASAAMSPERPPRVEETHVTAPLGRTVVEGRVVSVKSYDSQFGTTTKMTVKVTTADGVWLCWGTVLPNVNVGDVVRFRATLELGKEKHFVFAKRPFDLRTKKA